MQNLLYRFSAVALVALASTMETASASKPFLNLPPQIVEERVVHDSEGREVTIQRMRARERR